MPISYTLAPIGCAIEVCAYREPEQMNSYVMKLHTETGFEDFDKKVRLALQKKVSDALNDAFGYSSSTMVQYGNRDGTVTATFRDVGPENRDVSFEDFARAVADGVRRVERDEELAQNLDCDDAYFGFMDALSKGSTDS